MSSTLVTTEAGSAAAGFEGVSEGATGNPRQGQANPIPLPANPMPESLQYVTVYDNGNKGGFAGSRADQGTARTSAARSTSRPGALNNANCECRAVLLRSRPARHAAMRDARSSGRRDCCSPRSRRSPEPRGRARSSCPR